MRASTPLGSRHQRKREVMMSQYRVLCGLLSVALLSLDVESLGASCQQEEDRLVLEQDCGAYATGVVLSLLDKELLPFAALKRELAIGASGTCSLADIQRVLEASNVRARSMKLGDAPPDTIAIVAKTHPGGDSYPAHFQVVRPRSDGLFTIYDPPFFISHADWSVLRKDLQPVMLVCYENPHFLTRPMVWFSFAALALVIPIGMLLRRVWPLSHAGISVLAALTCLGCGSESHGSGDAGAEGHIEFEPADIYVKSDLIGRMQVSAWVINRFDEPITIENVLSSCGCAGTTFNRTSPMQPGERRKCIVDVEVSNVPRTATIYLNLSRGGGAAFRVHLPKAEVRGVTLPQRIDLGDVSVGVPATHKVQLDFLSGAVSLADEEGQIGPISWLAEKNSLLSVKDEAARSVQVDDLPCKSETEITIRPLVEGSGSAELTAFVGGSLLKSTVTWNAVSALTVEPAILRLRRSGEADWVGSAVVRYSQDADLVPVLQKDSRVKVKREPLSSTESRILVHATSEWCKLVGAGQVKFAVKVEGKDLVELAIPIVAELD